MAVTGNTIRINMEFVTFAGSRSDVTELHITVFDTMRNVIEVVQIDKVKHLDVGVYQLDYVVPDGYGDATFEVKAILEDTPIVGRTRIEREWLK